MCVLLSLFWPTFQSLIYELVDEDGCSSSFDISTRITQCAGFSSIRMYDDHDEVSHWVKSEQSEDCKHVFFWIFWLEGLGIYWRYRNRYRAFWVPEKSIGIGIVKIWYRKKVSVSVSKISGTGKKYRYRYRSKLWVTSHSALEHFVFVYLRICVFVYLCICVFHIWYTGMSYLISLNPMLLKNKAYVWELCICVFVYLCICLFVYLRICEFYI